MLKESLNIKSMANPDFEIQPHEKTLINYNWACGILHFVQGLIAIIASFTVTNVKNFKINLYTFFAIWDEANNNIPAPNQV